MAPRLARKGGYVRLVGRGFAISAVRLDALPSASEKPLPPVPEVGRPRLLLPSQMSAYERFAPVLDALPPIDFGIAYGSGVMEQAERSGPAPLIDFIVSAPDLEAFHAENLRRNPSHYPMFARALGPRFVAWANESWGAGLWYVTMVRVHGLEVKYGVVSSSTLVQDLEQWKTLYVAGRLQKPVLVLRETPEIGAALSANLRYALSYALLLLPERFSEFELWEKITSISYSGDPRMNIPGGENPRKIQNIVRGKNVLEGFRSLYANHVGRVGLRFADSSTPRPAEQVAKFLWHGNGEAAMQQPGDGEHLAQLLTDLPRPLKVKVAGHFKANVDDQAAWRGIVDKPGFRQVVENGKLQVPGKS